MRISRGRLTPVGPPVAPRTPTAPRTERGESDRRAGMLGDTGNLADTKPPPGFGDVTADDGVNVGADTEVPAARHVRNERNGR